MEETYEKLVAQRASQLDDADLAAVLNDWILANDEERAGLLSGDEGRVKECLEKHGPEWFGRDVVVRGATVVLRDEEDAPSIELTFRGAFIDKLLVTTTWDGSRDGWGQEWILNLLPRILKHRAGSLIRDMELRATPNDEFVYEGLVEAVTSSAPLSVRKLYAGDDDQLSWTHVPDVSTMWAAAPWLLDVTLQGSSIQLGELRHSRLRSLRLISGGLPQEAMTSVVDSQLPALEHLEVWFGSSEYGAECNIDSVQPLLGRAFPSLKSVALVNCEFADELCAILPHARWLAQLNTLQIGKGILRDAGAEVLLGNANKFLHLDVLDVQESYLTAAVVERLRTAFGARLRADGQKQPSHWRGEDHFYVSVGE